MKKINFTFLVLLIALSSMAQYKKSNYFGKDGRTYGLGIRIHMLGDYSGLVNGYTLSLGRDVAGKRFFSAQEITLIPSYKTQLAIWEGGNDIRLAKFTTKPQVLYTFNFNWFLLKNDNSDRRVKPYLTAGIGLKLTGGLNEVDRFSSEPAADLPFSAHLNGGAGLFFYIKSWLGIKAEGGYSYQNSLSNTGLDQKDYALPNHAYASAGLVFRIEKDK